MGLEFRVVGLLGGVWGLEPWRRLGVGFGGFFVVVVMFWWFCFFFAGLEG